MLFRSRRTVVASQPLNNRAGRNPTKFFQIRRILFHQLEEHGVAGQRQRHDILAVGHLGQVGHVLPENRRREIRGVEEIVAGIGINISCSLSSWSSGFVNPTKKISGGVIISGRNLHPNISERVEVPPDCLHQTFVRQERGNPCCSQPGNNHVCRQKCAARHQRHQIFLLVRRCQRREKILRPTGFGRRGRRRRRAWDLERGLVNRARDRIVGILGTAI